jgi:hypothetical protein
MAKKKKVTPSIPTWVKYTWWAIPLLAILVYIPSFNADFTLDDIPIIKDNPYMKSTDSIPSIWTTHYWAGKVDSNDKGLYRPLTLTTYNLQYAISGKQTSPFHIINILLHALVCFMLMKMVHLLFKDYRIVVIAGLLFAIHPLHTEAVAGIVGRAELLASLFILTSMICYHHWQQKGTVSWLVLLLLSTFAAIMSKEHGFLIAPILVLQETYYYFTTKNYAWGEKRKWIALVSVLFISFALWIYRSTITGPPVPHEQWLGVSSANRMATAFKTTSDYIIMHLWPMPLSADYWTDEVPIIGFGNAGALIGLLLVIGLLALSFIVRQKWPVVSWGILFFFLSLLPVSNLVFAAGFLKAERILYIPSIGLIVTMAVLIVQLLDLQRGKTAGLVLLGLLFLFFTWRTVIRVGDWKNNYTLALATLETSPNSPRFNNMMGLELRDQKKNKEALVYFQKAVQASPNHVPALVNLGMEYSNTNRSAEAVPILEKAIQIDPNTAMAYVNLMAVYRNLGNYDKNLETAEKALILFPDFPPVLWNAGNAYHLKGNIPKADELRGKAQSIDPSIGGGK